MLASFARPWLRFQTTCFTANATRATAHVMVCGCVSWHPQYSLVDTAKNRLVTEGIDLAIRAPRPTPQQPSSHHMPSTKGRPLAGAPSLCGREALPECEGKAGREKQSRGRRPASVRNTGEMPCLGRLSIRLGWSLTNGGARLDGLRRSGQSGEKEEIELGKEKRDGMRLQHASHEPYRLC